MVFKKRFKQNRPCRVRFYRTTIYTFNQRQAVELAQDIQLKPNVSDRRSKDRRVVFENLKSVFQEETTPAPYFFENLPMIFDALKDGKKYWLKSMSEDNETEFLDSFYYFLGENKAGIKRVQYNQAKHGNPFFLYDVVDAPATATSCNLNQSITLEAISNFIGQTPDLWFKDAKKRNDFSILERAMFIDDYLKRKPDVSFESDLFDFRMKRGKSVLTEHLRNGKDLVQSYEIVMGNLMTKIVKPQQKLILA